MSTSIEVFGFGNRWASYAFQHAVTESGEDLSIRHADAPSFLALKFEAFGSPTRENGGDYYASRDFEDIFAVVTGRLEIEAEIALAEADLREFVLNGINAFVRRPDLDDLISAHLPGDSASQGRAPEVRARLERMARMA